jgi:D-sedoheptulose 7-phosphate isomerase
MKTIIFEEFQQHLKACHLTIDALSNLIESAADACINSLNNNGKILLFGNGGSASDAQHIAAELIGRYKVERDSLPAIALTTDSSVITSISNDFGYSEVFRRQISALANPNDVVIGISTSGMSSSVNKGLIQAKDIGCKVIGFNGMDGGEMKGLCDINLLIPVNDTPRVQEMHIVIGHIICHLIDIHFNES